VPLIIVVVWQVACVSGLCRRGYAGAKRRSARGLEAAAVGRVARNIWSASARQRRFVIGGGIGFAFGLMNGLSQLSSKLTDTTLQMVRNIPHLALIPWSSCVRHR